VPARSRDRPMYLSNLGNALGMRFKRLGDPANLEEAVTGHDQAVRSTPPGSTELPLRLNSLGNLLRQRYERSGDSAGLDRAIDAFERAVARTPPRSTHLPARVATLPEACWTATGAVGRLPTSSVLSGPASGRSPGRLPAPRPPGLLEQSGQRPPRSPRPPGWVRQPHTGDPGVPVEQPKRARGVPRPASSPPERGAAGPRAGVRGRRRRRPWATASTRLIGSSPFSSAGGTRIPGCAGGSAWRPRRPMPGPRSVRCPGAVVALEAGRAQLLAEVFDRARVPLERLVEHGRGDLATATTGPLAASSSSSAWGSARRGRHLSRARGMAGVRAGPGCGPRRPWPRRR
jgi:hypothetical protein